MYSESPDALLGSPLSSTGPMAWHVKGHTHTALLSPKTFASCIVGSITSEGLK